MMSYSKEQKALIAAAARGDNKTIKSLLNLGIEVRGVRVKAGEPTPSMSSSPILNIDETDSYGHTALMHAIIENNPETAIYLYKHGANIKIKNAIGLDAFVLSLLFCPAMADHLIKEGKHSKKISHCYAYEGNLPKLKKLIKKGKVKYDYKLLTLIAIANDHLEMAKWLVEKKSVNLTLTDDMQMADFVIHPLNLATGRASLDMVKWVCSLGTIPFIAYTIACHTSVKRDLDFFKFLEKRLLLIQNIKKRNKHADQALDFIMTREQLFTTLVFAIRVGNTTIIDYLLNKYPHTYIFGSALERAFTHTVMDSSEYEKFFIKDKHPKIYGLISITGLAEQILHIAANEGNLVVFKHLVEAKSIKINVADCNKNTALHIAASKGNLPLTEYILNNAPKLLFKSNVIGETPFELIKKSSGGVGFFDKHKKSDLHQVLRIYLAGGVSKKILSNKELLIVAKKILNDIDINKLNKADCVKLKKCFKKALRKSKTLTEGENKQEFILAKFQEYYAKKAKATLKK